MKSYMTLDDVNLNGKNVLLRGDLNVPMQDGKITDMNRIERLLPTLKELVAKGAAVTLVSHFGRPNGTSALEYSLKPIFEVLKSELPGVEVRFEDSYINANLPKVSEILLLENLRFDPREEKNDMSFARELSRFGDIYVNDAFSASHRAHSSIEAITHLLPSYAGRLMEEELNALEKTMGTPERPLMAIVGGSKVSTKLELLLNLVQKVDVLAICGAMANTFLKAKGKPVGASLVEDDLIPTALEILKRAELQNCKILLPVDLVVAPKIEKGIQAKTIFLKDIRDQDMILDVGPLSWQNLAEHAERSRTLIWNGPLGVFEVPPFDEGTNSLAEAVAKLTKAGNLLSVAGGGDTVAALTHAGVLDNLSYVSSAGGAFLEWLEGRSLPGVVALKRALGSNTEMVVPSSTVL